MSLISVLALRSRVPAAVAMVPVAHLLILSLGSFLRQTPTLA